MIETAPDELKIVALNGMLGYGYRLASLEEGVAQKPDMIGVDAGSTDAGPYYLGSGGSLTRPGQVYRDLRHGVVAARRAGIPMIVGSAGFGGGAPHVAGIVEMVRRIASEDKLSLRCAVIQSEMNRQLVLDALRDGRIEPMTGVPDLTEEDVSESERIVAQMGTGPLIAALRQGVDLVIAGRSCDAAIFAAAGAGEFFSLTLDEFEATVRAAAEVTAGRMPLVAGCHLDRMGNLNGECSVSRQGIGQEGLIRRQACIRFQGPAGKDANQQGRSDGGGHAGARQPSAP